MCYVAHIRFIITYHQFLVHTVMPDHTLHTEATAHFRALVVRKILRMKFLLPVRHLLNDVPPFQISAANH